MDKLPLRKFKYLYSHKWAANVMKANGSVSIKLPDKRAREASASSKEKYLRWFNTCFTFLFTPRRLLCSLVFLCFTTQFLYLLCAESGGGRPAQYFNFTTQNGHFVSYSRLDSFKKSCSDQEDKILERERQIFQTIRQEHIQLIERFNQLNANIQEILQKIPQKEAELAEMEFRIAQLRLLQRELSDRRNVRLKLPNAPLKFAQIERSSQRISPPSNKIFHSLEDSLDYRRCSISSPFRFYLYEHLPDFRLHSTHSIFDELSASHFRTRSADEACLFVSVGERRVVGDANTLKYWGEFGRNHVILLNAPDQATRTSDFGAAFIVTSTFGEGSFRSELDVTVQLNVPSYNITEYQRFPRLLPFVREHLLSFITPSSGVSPMELQNIESLRTSMRNSGDSFLVDLHCLQSKTNGTERLALCYDEKRRVILARRSHFALILANCSSFQTRFYEALLAGAIPVIASTREPLPFEELVDWRLAAIRVAAPRLPEVHFILRAISTADLLEMRRKGRFFLENYLANTKVLTRTILSTLRYRLQLLADGAPSSELPVIEKNVTSFISTATKPPYDDEYLGPVETSMPSPAYTHNMTSLRMYSYKLWNEFPSLTEFTPEFLESDYAFPSEAEFDDETSFGMRPISPGSGREFAVALGGNRPREQFTIVMATFNRDLVLNASLERLHKLPYLNKVIVIWNNADRPNHAHWPRIHVPIVFLRATRNSLNNRFLPFKEIETEAVLSLDDDIDLKQHEIIFAFRTWRENRHRIVGFPARYHAKYGDSMFYNSNHTCQLSMILTGAAFLHKSYLHAYTNLMPEIIRKKVDEWMNCEDLAMNFLVSHLTRQPPIKTTSKWTIRCPTCPDTLSDDETHFNERHNCIRFFTQVYGYNPLLFSQFRADSVLFKTRVPQNHQKCFSLPKIALCPKTGSGSSDNQDSNAVPEIFHWSGSKIWIIKTSFPFTNIGCRS